MRQQRPFANQMFTCNLRKYCDVWIERRKRCQFALKTHRTIPQNQSHARGLARLIWKVIVVTAGSWPEIARSDRLPSRWEARVRRASTVASAPKAGANFGQTKHFLAAIAKQECAPQHRVSDLCARRDRCIDLPPRGSTNETGE